MNKDDFLNPDFATSTYDGKASLTEEELKSILERDYTIYRKFERKGYIHSKDFSFITHATFSEDINSLLEGKRGEYKTPERKLKAIKMKKYVEDYFNSIYLNNEYSFKPLKVEFIARHDNECALFNPNRYTIEQIKNILMELFSK